MSTETCKIHDKEIQNKMDLIIRSNIDVIEAIQLMHKGIMETNLCLQELTRFLKGNK